MTYSTLINKQLGKIWTFHRISLVDMIITLSRPANYDCVLRIIPPSRQIHPLCETQEDSEVHVPKVSVSINMKHLLRKNHGGDLLWVGYKNQCKKIIITRLRDFPAWLLDGRRFISNHVIQCVGPHTPLFAIVENTTVNLTDSMSTWEKDFPGDFWIIKQYPKWDDKAILIKEKCACHENETYQRYSLPC